MKQLKKIVARISPKLYQTLVKIKKQKIWQQFLNKYPNTKIFPQVSKTDRRLHSQANQDFIVYENFFKNKTDGFFCDIGGNHPTNINNTWYFEKLGWQGIVFEPLPHMKTLWDENRKAKVFPIALSDARGEVSFNVVDDVSGWEDMLSYVKGSNNAIKDYNYKEIKVQTETLKQILEQENITHIDYLSLDVEGHELKVLNGIDFEKVRINVLTIENNPPGFEIEGNEEIRRLMLQNNFRLWGRINGLDDIFVHNEFCIN